MCYKLHNLLLKLAKQNSPCKNFLCENFITTIARIVQKLNFVRHFDDELPARRKYSFGYAHEKLLKIPNWHLKYF